MREYLIRRTDGEWFDLPFGRWPEVMRPNSISSHPVEGWGNHRIEVEGVAVAFSDEDPGVHISFEGELPEAVARRLVEEVLENIERTTCQRGRIVEL
jgi:hypothetical protein